MKTHVKLIIVAALAVAVIAAVALKQKSTTRSASGNATSGQIALTTAVSNAPDNLATAAPPATISTKLPKLLDLGADKCIPCKMMAPILEELKKEYAGRLEVEFIDVWKNPEAGQRYGIRVIPTQIFYDADGKERFRHVGFMSKEDILAKWKELGVELK